MEDDKQPKVTAPHANQAQAAQAQPVEQVAPGAFPTKPAPTTSSAKPPECAFVPEILRDEWKSTNVLDLCQTFFTNPFSDRFPYSNLY
jgi:hypothetical protein